MLHDCVATHFDEFISAIIIVSHYTYEVDIRGSIAWYSGLALSKTPLYGNTPRLSRATIGRWGSNWGTVPHEDYPPTRNH